METTASANGGEADNVREKITHVNVIMPIGFPKYVFTSASPFYVASLPLDLGYQALSSKSTAIRITNPDILPKPHPFRHQRSRACRPLLQSSRPPSSPLVALPR